MSCYLINFPSTADSHGLHMLVHAMTVAVLREAIEGTLSMFILEFIMSNAETLIDKTISNLCVLSCCTN